MKSKILAVFLLLATGVRADTARPIMAFERVQ